MAITGLTLDKSSGKGPSNVNVTVPANPTIDDRSAELTVESGGKSQIVEVKQKGASIVIPEFDFLTLTYSWTTADGRDLDTATEFTNTGLGIDKKPVGAFLDSSIGDYLLFGGDVLQPGGEMSLIQMSNLLGGGNFDKLPPVIQVDMMANWYADTLGLGNVEFRFAAYKGGEMRKSGRIWENIGGEMVYDGVLKSKITAVGKSNHKNIYSFYQRFASMFYDKTFRTCSIAAI